MAYFQDLISRCIADKPGVLHQCHDRPVATYGDVLFTDLFKHTFRIKIQNFPDDKIILLPAFFGFDKMGEIGRGDQADLFLKVFVGFKNACGNAACIFRILDSFSFLFNAGLNTSDPASILPE